MNRKSILLMVLAMVFMCSNVFAATVVSILDMPIGWSKDAVTEAVENGVLIPENGQIRPMDPLTRAEMAQGITNAFGATKKADISQYNDVPRTQWYYEDMQEAVAMGIMSGYGNGLIKPEKKITREELFTVIYNTLELEEGSLYYLNKFNDKDLVSGWAKGIVARMVQNRYVAGNAKGNVKPIDSITREEFAQVMKNIVAEYYSVPGTYTNIPAGNIVISTPDVVLKNATVTGDLIIADGVGTGEVTLDNVKVLGRTLVRGGGENSIKIINNTTLNGKVVVNNRVGKVRLYNSKSTVKNVEVKTPIILEGEYGNVEVKKSTGVETKGDINNLIINEKSEVTVTSGTVAQIQVKETAAATTVSGKGKVTQVNVNANDVEVTVAKAKVTAAGNVSGVLAGKVAVETGKTETVKGTSSGGGGGGGGGGGSSSSSTVWTLSYNANGGSNAPASQSHTKTSSEIEYTFTISDSVPTKTGFEFKGWSTSSSVMTATFKPGDTITVKSSVTLYAVWETAVYTVTFDTNGGSKIEAQTVEYGKTVSKPADPVKAGHTFLGWYEEGASAAFEFATSITANKTLKARWQVNTYTIVWKNYDGKVLETDEGVAYGTMPTYDGITPTKSADSKCTYEFIGWTPQVSKVEENAEYTAAFKALTITYTVTFDSNGGSEVAKQTVAAGSKATEPAKPTKAGYDFVGWYEEGSTTLFVFETPITENKTLKANWILKQNGTAVLRYDLKGGTGNFADQSYELTGTKTSYEFTVSTVKPEKAGYTFLGWAYTADATSANVGTTVEVGNETKTIYAVWKLNENGTVGLSYNANGGNRAPEDEEYKLTGTETSHVFTVSDVKPTREGHIFLGWAYTADATRADVGETVEVSNGIKVIYAVWEIKTYTVTFDSNEGSVVRQQTVDYGETVIEPKDPTREGYTFAGWYEEGSTVSFDFETPITENKTLKARWEVNTYTIVWKNYDGTVLETDEGVAYGTTPSYDGETPLRPSTSEYKYTFARWDPNVTVVTGNATYKAKYTQKAIEAPVTYTVTFNSNGGSSVNAQTIVEGKVATKPGDPTREGYTFLGWYEEGSDVAFDFTAPITSNKALKANWEVNTYTVTWKNYDETVLEKDEGVAYGTTPTYDGKTPVKTADAQFTYTFAGWEPQIVDVKDNATYTATYTQNPIGVTRYTAAFDSNGGSGVASQTVVAGNKVTKPADPTKAGYTFAGWYEDAGLTIEYDFNKNVNGNITIYAKWIEKTDVTMCTLTFDKNIMHSWESAANPVTAEKGTTVTVTTYARITGYTFVGWALSPDSQEADYGATISIMLDKDITLYGIWQCNACEKINCIDEHMYCEECQDYWCEHAANTISVSGTQWAGSADITKIEKVIFAKSYTGSSDASWNIGNAVKCCQTGNELIIAGNGGDYIYPYPTSGGMFAGFTNLKSIEGLSILNTSNVSDYAFEDMFAGCSSLTTLDLSNFDSANATDVSNMFSGCASLESITFGSKFTLSHVWYATSMFDGCSSLKELNLSNFNTHLIKSMSYMFRGCSSLETLDLGHFVISTGAAVDVGMEGMFAGCSSLKTLNISGFDTTRVSDMDYMFSGCSSLKVLNIGNFDTSNIFGSHMTDMFSGMDSLEQITLGKNFVFKSETGLKDITWYDKDGNSYTKEDVVNDNRTGEKTYYLSVPGQLDAGANWYKGNNKANIETITFAHQYTPSAGEQTWSADSSNTVLCYEKGTEVTIVVPNNSQEVMANKDSSNMFADFASLKAINNIDLLYLGNATNVSGMFSGCSALTGLDLSGFNTNKVTNMANMFNGCSVLTSLTLSNNFTTGNVTDMSYMFNGCSALPGLDLSGFNTNKVTNMNSMFNGCSQLMSLNTSSFDTSSATDMGSMFNGCAKVQTLDLGGFNTAKVTNMNSMFNGCNSLERLNLNSFDTNKVTDMSGMLNISIKNGANLKEVVLGTNFVFKGSETLPDTNNDNCVWYDNLGTQCAVNTIVTRHNGSANNQYTYFTENPVMLKSGTSWDNITNIEERKSITKITFMNQAYTGPYDGEPWNADAAGNGTIKGYKNGTEIIIAGQGKLLVNTNASQMFALYTSLQEINGLGLLDTSRVTDMSQMFAGFGGEGLTRLDLSAFNTSKVTTMAAMFYLCYNIEELDLSGSFDTSNVTDMSQMFGACKALKTITGLTGFDTSKVTNFTQIFVGCDSIVELDITNFKGDRLDDIDLTTLEKLCKVTVGNGISVRLPAEWYNAEGIQLKDTTDTGSPIEYVRDGIYYAQDPATWCDEHKVFNCEEDNSSFAVMFYANGESVSNLPDNITDIKAGTKVVLGNKNPIRAGYSFLGWSENSSATSATYQGGQEVKITRNMILYAVWKENANITTYTVTFNSNGGNSVELQTVESGKTVVKPQAPTKTGYLFGGWYKDSELTIEYDFTTPVTSDITLYAKWDADLAMLKSGFGWDNITEIEERKAITKITFMNQAYTGAYDGQPWNADVGNNGTILGYKNGTEIIIAGQGNMLVNSDASMMFAGYNSLQDISGLGFLDTRQVTNMSQMFASFGGETLTYLDLSSFNTSNVTDMSGMFYLLKCKSVNVSSFDTSKVVTMSTMFAGPSLESIIGLTSFNIASLQHTINMFASCSSIVELDLSGFEKDSYFNVYGTGLDGLCKLMLGRNIHFQLPYKNDDSAWYNSKGEEFEQGTYVGGIETYYRYEPNRWCDEHKVFDCDQHEVIPTTYTITVVNGYANLSKAEAGTTVTITANSAPEGKEFDKWVVNAGGVTLTDEYSVFTTFVMGTADVIVEATYKDIEVVPTSYTITVENGWANPSLALPGTPIGIFANEAPEGKEFDKWIVKAGEVDLEDENAESTTFVMGTADVIVEATYKDIENGTARLVYNANTTDEVINMPENPEPQDLIGSNLAYEFTISSEIPKRLGYKFVNWSSVNDGSGIEYKPGGSILIGNEEIVLYAIWEACTNHQFDEEEAIYEYNGNTSYSHSVKNTCTECDLLVQITSYEECIPYRAYVCVTDEKGNKLDTGHYYLCQRCGHNVYGEGAIEEHKYPDSGENTDICRRCGYENKHDWDNGTYVYNPSTFSHTFEKTCNICGKVDKSEPVACVQDYFPQIDDPSAGHDYRCITCGGVLTKYSHKFPTDGENMGICEECGYVCKHPEDKVSVTCKYNGATSYIHTTESLCAVCGKVEIEEDGCTFKYICKKDTDGNMLAIGHSVECEFCDYYMNLENHFFTNGVCLCGYGCKHNWNSEGVCIICRFNCQHEDKEKPYYENNGEGTYQHTEKQKCNTCQIILINGIENCNDYYKFVPHFRSPENGHIQDCTRCGEYKTTVADDHIYNGGVCTECGYVCQHPDYVWYDAGKYRYLGDGTHEVVYECDDCGHFIYVPEECEVDYMQIDNFKHAVVCICTRYEERDHDYDGDTCSLCDAICFHKNYNVTPVEKYWENGVCRACGTECTHSWNAGSCTECGLECTEHTWIFGRCSICNFVCQHKGEAMSARHEMGASEGLYYCVHVYAVCGATERVYTSAVNGICPVCGNPE